jgi:general secretion pathway protein G
MKSPVNHPTKHPMKNHRSTRALRSGFTLLEMVIVLGIIAVLLGGSIALIGGIGDSAKMQRVDADFNSLGSAIEGYKLNAGNYPTTQQGLKALIERPTTSPQPRRWVKVIPKGKIPQDPWGKDYRYAFPGSKNASTFELVSNGPDGIPNNQDDISSQDE